MIISLPVEIIVHIITHVLELKHLIHFVVVNKYIYNIYIDNKDYIAYSILSNKGYKVKVSNAFILYSQFSKIDPKIQNRYWNLQTAIRKEYMDVVSMMINTTHFTKTMLIGFLWNQYKGIHKSSIKKKIITCILQKYPDLYETMVHYNWFEENIF